MWVLGYMRLFRIVRYMGLGYVGLRIYKVADYRVYGTGVIWNGLSETAPIL